MARRSRACATMSEGCHYSGNERRRSAKTSAERRRSTLSASAVAGSRSEPSSACRAIATASSPFTSDLSAKEYALARRLWSDAVGSGDGLVGRPAWVAELRVVQLRRRDRRDAVVRGALEPVARALVRPAPAGGAIRGRRCRDRHRDDRQELSRRSGKRRVRRVRHGGARNDALPRRGRSGPRMCALSGQDVDKLRRIGAEILGVIGHTSVVCVALSMQANQMMSSWWGNQEMTEVTQGVYAARHLAMSEVRRQATAAGANDMVISTLTPRHRPPRVREPRLSAALLHRLDARARHRHSSRRARAASGPARSTGPVDQPRRLATPPVQESS